MHHIIPTCTVEAKPYAYTFPLEHTALLVIDMQRDFLLANGFGSSQGQDMTDVQGTIPYVQQLLRLFRDLNMHIVHTREGHVPDLSDCPSSKLLRNLPTRPADKALTIGDKGEMGRLLVRGEYGQDIVDEVQPIPGEVVLDKPGKGAFWNTKLMEKLKARAITHLVVTGVTTECCFATTIREANDRGFECCGVVEATAGYNKAFKTSSLDMLNWAGGLFGFVASISSFGKAMKHLSNNAMTSLTTNGDLAVKSNGLSPDSPIAAEALPLKANGIDNVESSSHDDIPLKSNGFHATDEHQSAELITNGFPKLGGGSRANGTIKANGHSCTNGDFKAPSLNWDGDLSIKALANSYKRGVSPSNVIEELYKKIEAYREVDPAVWIHLEPKEKALRAAEALESTYHDRDCLPPLFGVPFSVKDSIDVEGIPTTTACPPLALTASKSAVVHEKVVQEGALFIGKTNLDQLATGLSGCRSPYGITHSIFNKDFISGGSSSGNAVSVGAGLVSFSIATDTAGSGRVPALFNGVVGFKPTRGTLSAQGLTPACPSLDCIALMAPTVDDVRKVWWVVEGYDDDYIYSKFAPSRPRAVNALGPQAKSFRFGVPPLEAIRKCSKPYQKKFEEAVTTMQSMGGRLTPVNWSPFEKGGDLLYDGTFVSERLAALPDGWFEANREHLHPVIREIFERVIARSSTAIDAYRDLMAQKLLVGPLYFFFITAKITPTNYF